MEILGLAADGNRYFDRSEPWKLVKSDRARAAHVLYLCTALAASLAVLAAPFIPGAADRALRMIGLPGTPRDAGRWTGAAGLLLAATHRIGEPIEPLFKKLLPDEVARVRAIVTDPPNLRDVLGLP
jgi:methionyl-tRNA synthetase